MSTDKPKSPVQQKLDNLQKNANVAAENAPIKEEPIEIPKDIDKSRLAEVTKELQNPAKGLADARVEENPVPKTAVLPHIPPTTIKAKDVADALVLSVTDVPYTPAKDGEQSLQKFHILIETSKIFPVGTIIKVK